MSQRRLLLIASLAVTVVVALAARRWGMGDAPRVAPIERPLAALEQLAEGFPEPAAGALDLPRDHGPRPEQFAESWQFAGRLDARDGENYGFQLAFQRIAVQPDTPERESAWATRDVYRARFSLEPAGDAARGEERLSRAALGLAGATRDPVRTWLEDWSFEVEGRTGDFLLRAADAGVGMELRLKAADSRPMRIDEQLYRGYWWPGLVVEGAVLVDGRRVRVSGRAMLERLWGRAAPTGRGQLALARLWLEDDAGALRCERLQRRDGGGTPLLQCIGHELAVEQLALEPADDGWRNVRGVRYPLAWEARLSAGGEAMRVEPLSAGIAWSDGTWSGVIAAAGRAEAWGLLELSNFPAP
ncbi:MAG TPA: lipocalin-like domain-containing protein [Gammaproteobacteria bacterium]|nr:lipocalin-like domain-containing protein [Gammaproteobacteria bacterium]